LSLFILLQHETLLSRSTQGHSLRFYVQRLQVFLLVEKKEEKKSNFNQFFIFFRRWRKTFSTRRRKIHFLCRHEEEKNLKSFSRSSGIHVTKMLHTTYIYT
jgi:hypothetical protein